MNSKLRVFAVLASLLFVATTIPVARAQSVDSSVQGAVLDSSGAAVAGADVHLSNVQTGFVLDTKTDGQGNYVFPAVAPGV
jgi:hypothetical protein